MFETYNPISNLTATPIGDITTERNSLGYLILSPGSSINIPAVVKLYDYIKFKEIIDTTFTEIFPNDNVQPSILDLQAQINTLNAQLSGSQSQIDNLNTIIDGLQAPGAELELWRTRKTFKRIVDGLESLYPSGFPTVNNWPQSTWNSYGGALSKVFGPTLTAEEQQLIDAFRTDLNTVQTNVNGPNNALWIDLALTINESVPWDSTINLNGVLYSGSPTYLTNPIIARLHNPSTITSVTKQEIDTLLPSDIPPIYKQVEEYTGTGGPYSFTNPDGTPIYGDIYKFRILCKQYVYSAIDISNNNQVTLPPTACLMTDGISKSAAESLLGGLYGYISLINNATGNTTWWNNIP